ncbi:hypothetical protein ACTXT7_007388 [Hymenolepis weldensis]
MYAQNTVVKSREKIDRQLKNRESRKLGKISMRPWKILLNAWDGLADVNTGSSKLIHLCRLLNVKENHIVLSTVKMLTDTATELELRQAIENFRENLQHSINAKNLNRYITAYMQRKPLTERLGDLK